MVIKGIISWPSITIQLIALIENRNEIEKTGQSPNSYYNAVRLRENKQQKENKLRNDCKPKWQCYTLPHPKKSLKYFDD